MAQQVTCITKRGDHYDPHERIAHIGGSGLKVTQAQGIADVKADSGTYYVSAAAGSAYLIVRQHKWTRLPHHRSRRIDPEQPSLAAGVPVTRALTHLEPWKQET
jgi:hypothetical protein